MIGSKCDPVVNLLGSSSFKAGSFDSSRAVFDRLFLDPDQAKVLLKGCSEKMLLILNRREQESQQGGFGGYWLPWPPQVRHQVLQVQVLILLPFLLEL